jgi:hypothetical protein
MKRLIAAAFAFTITLAGCASSSGVLKMGPDTYSITAQASPARGGTAGAKQMALQEANQFCEKMSKEIFVTNFGSATTNDYGAGDSSLTFRCLAKGDPELHRPDYRKAPSTVIEDRRR